MVASGMSRGWAGALAVAALVGLWGCGGTKVEPDAGVDAGAEVDAGTDPCEGVTCGANEACNPASGACEQNNCDPACSGATPICDPATVSCKACTASAGCSGATPTCDPAANGGVGACVACVSNAQCSGATPICNASTCVTCTATAGCTGAAVCDVGANGGLGACVGCKSDDDCTGSTPACDTATETCVGCLGDAYCSPAAPVCNVAAKSCAVCLSNDHCSGDTPVCNGAANGGAGACVGCVGDADCGGATPVCDPVTQSCATCVQDSDCPSDGACNTAVAGGACVACVTDLHCGGATPTCDLTTHTCVGCVADTDCGGATPVCDTASNTCVGCTANAHCPVSAPLCAGGACVQCMTTADCGAAEVCFANTCQPLNDTCASAQDIAFASGSDVATFTVDTTAASHQYSGTCAPTTNRPELVYRLTLTAARDVAIDVQSSAGSDAVFFVRAAPCATGTQLSCRNATGTGGAETATLLNLQPGDYFLFIENDGAAALQATATVTLSPPTTAPTGDSCAQPLALNVTPGTPHTFQVDTVSATDAHQGTCHASASGGRERVYQLTLTAAQDIQVDAVGQGGVDPVLYLRASPCASGTELSCRHAVGTSESLTVKNRPAGTYYLFVEQAGSTTGIIDVTVNLNPPTPPPANDTCAAPSQLTVVPGTPTSLVADTSAATDAQAGTCVTAAGSQELVYAFTTAAPHDIVVTATGATGVNPALYLRASPCGSGAQLACIDATFAGGTETFTSPNRPAGTYYLFVETVGAAAGAVDVTVSLDSPTLTPANDTCAAPQLLSVTPGTPTTFTADTTSATNAHQGTCYNSGTGAAVGRELVYQLTLTSPQDINVVAVGRNTVDPVLYLRSSPCATGTELACQDAAGVTETLSALNRPAGTYFLFVEQWGTTAGLIDVSVSLDAPSAPSANATCATAQPLTLPATVTGLTSGNTDDYQVAAACGSGAGPDVVYAFTTSAPGTFSARVTPLTRGFRPTVSVRNLANCIGGTSVDTAGCMTAPHNDHPVDLVVSELPAGSWYLVVDGSTSTQGRFELTASHTPFAPGTNNACASVQPLALSAAGNAYVTGSTRGMTSTTTTSCGTSTSVNPDAFFGFTPPALPLGATGYQAKVIAVGLNSEELHPVLSVRTDCATTTSTGQAFCATTDQAPYLVAGIFNPLPGVPYFAVVDGSGTTRTNGPFSLEVNLAPVPHPQDSCSGAQPLPANTTVAGTTLGASNSFELATGWYTGCTTATMGGPDVVYAYTAPSTGLATAYLRPQRGYTAALSVHSACAPTSCAAFVGPTTVSQPGLLFFNTVAGNTYYLIVDNTGLPTSTLGTRAGGFHLSVSQ
jgi:hypothetical protein